MINLTNTISDTINIDILSVHPNDLTVYMDTLIAIPLETTETSLFGAIDKIVVWDSMIYVLDKHYSKAVFVFIDHGRFLYRLFRVGKGPGEYTDIFDMDVDLNYIYLLDSGWKILKYDRLTGATVDEYSFDHWKGREFAVINNGQSVFYNKGFKKTDYFSFNMSSCQIYETNFIGSYSKCVYRHNSRLASTYTHPVLTFGRHRDEVYAMPGYEYNFYNLTDSGLQEEVHFNFGKYNLDLERVSAVYKTPHKGF